MKDPKSIVILSRRSAAKDLASIVRRFLKKPHRATLARSLAALGMTIVFAMNKHFLQ
jgi:hypothetical protein